MRIIFEDGFTEEDIQSSKPIIINNTIQNIYAIICAMQKLKISYESSNGQVYIYNYI